MLHKNKVSIYLFVVLFAGLTQAQWKQRDFVIGTFGDPWLEGIEKNNITAYVATDSSRLLTAKNAGFNLLTFPGSGYDANALSRAGTTKYIDYALSIAARVKDIKYLIYDNRFPSSMPNAICQPNPPPDPNCTWDILPYTFTNTTATALTDHYKTVANSDYLYGYHLKDEPSAPAVWSTTDSDALTIAPVIKNWIAHIKTNDPNKLAFINLLPAYAVGTDAEYEAYVREFIDDASTNNKPDVIGFDCYLALINSGDPVRYLYNLRTIRRLIGSRPFWCYPTTLDPNGLSGIPDASYLRFESFCPIAYGAKGLIYWCYEHPSSTLIRHGVQQSNYNLVKSVNLYIKNVIGPVVMNTSSLGAFHMTNFNYLPPLSGAEIIPTAEIISTSTPYVANLSNTGGTINNCMVGIFRGSGEFYLLVINRGYWNTQPIIDCNVTLKGCYTNRVFETRISNHTYTRISTSFNSNNNLTTFQVAQLLPGEGRLYKVKQANLVPIRKLINE